MRDAILEYLYYAACAFGVIIVVVFLLDLLVILTRLAFGGV